MEAISNDWDNELTLKFLDLLAGERVIWDPKHKNHKQKHKIHDAWKRISDVMHTPIEELKSKKKSLMATFRPLLKKKQASIRSGAGEEDIFQPIWFAFDAMESFLGTLYNVEKTLNTEDELQQNQEEMQVLPSSLESDEYLSQYELLEDSLSNNESSKKSSKEHLKRKRKDTFFEEAQKNINESFNTLNNVLNLARVQEDECDIYAKLLAKKLRKYPENKRDFIMHRIDGILLDYPPIPNQNNIISAASSSSLPYLYGHSSNLTSEYVLPSPVRATESSETPPFNSNLYDISNLSRSM